ncbi:hypothetical protein OOK41_29705 [Micromonospora sp. NBC_01655]|uniref:hypothetical protein n=1 Tax=Micromonospora sp. NBC_01655 TaxID=2975983 RepID=UPI00224FE567|nr:hypothetical protein [Micromonospora sp. NBC_01655]MCX4474438.1 hypothetical protein [Micromonospora sp. NBC_01655]
MDEPRWLDERGARAWRGYRQMRRLLDLRLARESDGRGAVVTLTAQGRLAVEAAAPGHVAAVRRHLIDLLTADEIAATDALTRRVGDHLTDEGRSVR